MKEAIAKLEGLFVGQLNADELLLLEAATKAGIAYASYEGMAGLMGLAKVRLRS